MKKILILYFSGVGATKRVAEWMKASIPYEYEAKLFSVEQADAFDITDYDAFIIGTPAYHAAPARAVMDYFTALPPFSDSKPAFIFNTRGLYSCNTNRILAKALQKKHIITVMDKVYRGPASDVTLMIPSLQIAFEFDRGIQEKVAADCRHFAGLLQSETLKSYLPRFQIASIFNAPNKLLGQLLTIQIHLHKSRCIQCGKCIRSCPYEALETDNLNYPVFKKENCENCYRCVHHCPVMALSLSGRRGTKRVLTYPSITS